MILIDKLHVSAIECDFLNSVTCDLVGETKLLLLLEAFPTALKGELFHWNKSEYKHIIRAPKTSQIENGHFSL